MTTGNWKALYFLTMTALFSFYAGMQAQKRETVPVDKVMVETYLDSLLQDKRNKDRAYGEYCDPATRQQFKYWLQQEQDKADQDTTYLVAL